MYLNSILLIFLSAIFPVLLFSCEPEAGTKDNLTEDQKEGLEDKSKDEAEGDELDEELDDDSEDNTDEADDDQTTTNNTGNTNTTTNNTSSTETNNQNNETALPPPTLSYEAASFTYVKGKAITPLSPTTEHLLNPAYSISPSLPPGISLDPGTGQISGTPSQTYDITNLTVTASEGARSADFSFQLNVVIDHQEDFQNFWNEGDWTNGIYFPDADGMHTRQWEDNEKELSLSDDPFDTTDLLAYFRFNGGSGVTISTVDGDITDSSNAPIYNGRFYDNGSSSTYGDGQANDSISFDGDDHVAVTGLPLLDASVSVSFWLKPASLAATEVLFYQGNSVNATAFGVYTDPDTEVNILWGGGSFVLESSATLNLNEWQHLTVVRSGASGNWLAEVYLNGVLVDSGSSIATDPSADNTNNFIASSGSAYFSGELDEFMVFTRALDSDEIKYLYDRQQGVTDTGDFTSKIFDSETENMPWKTFSWELNGAFGTGLPNNSLAEEGYDSAHLMDASFLTDLVALYHFDGNGSASTDPGAIDDSSGSQHHGTAANANASLVYQESPHQQGLFFDGASDHTITIDHHSDLNFTNTISISAWVKLDSNNLTNEYYIINKYRTADDHRSYTLYLSNPSKVNFAFSSDGTGTITNRTSTANLTQDEWHHIVLTYDGADVVFYINGQEDSTQATTGNIFASNAPLTIGALPDAGVDFRGNLDEISIWRKVLSQADVTKLYERGSADVKFQIRACQVVDCSDASFEGPDGTGSTYFHEALYDFREMGESQFDLGDLNGRFFQYKLFYKNLYPNENVKVKKIRLYSD